MSAILALDRHSRGFIDDKKYCIDSNIYYLSSFRYIFFHIRYFYL